MKSKILRRKKENATLPKAATWLTCNERKGVAAVLVMFHKAGTLDVLGVDRDRALQWVRGGSGGCRDYLMVMMRPAEGAAEELVKTYWTQNYCMCEPMPLAPSPPTLSSPPALPQSTKQQIADLSLALSLLVEQSLTKTTEK